MKKSNFLFFTLLTLCIACGDDSSETVQPTTANSSAVINISNSTIIEGAGNSMLQFEVRASEILETSIEVGYTVTGLTANPGVDFTPPTGTVTLAAGGNTAMIAIPVIDDDINEVEEKINVTLTTASNGIIGNELAIGIIQDNDQPTNFDAEGYNTPEEYFGYQLAWTDEFTGDALNMDNYNFEIGDGCPNLCGWGNNELEYYTDSPENIRVEDGKLVMTATQLGSQGFRSARIQTKDKREFKFGRIDVRAKLPEGRGIWPAIWMLGANLDEVGWPASGEIDIMEMVGHTPRVTHGTAHWGNPGDPSTFIGNSISIDESTRSSL